MKTSSIPVIAWTVGLRLAVLCLATTPALAEVKSIGSIGLTVDSLEREVAFYTQVLPFEIIGNTEEKGNEVEQLNALPGAQTRVVTLKLGSEIISLTAFSTPRGKPIPTDSRSIDRWFQHIAIVVHDMDAAYAQLVRHKVKHVSTAPQTLPEWNKGAAGIKAFYFRDPEDHVLEIIYFPPGKGDPKWQQPTDKLFLGIDHTAIVVGDTDRSLAYYRDALGLRVAGEGENYGVEQEHLNQTFGARLRITGLRGPSGPGVEFLEYISPPGGRDLPPDAHVNDLLAWRTEIRVDNAFSVSRVGETALGHTVSNRVDLEKDLKSTGRCLVRDPDGHLLILAQEGRSADSFSAVASGKSQ